MTIIFVKPLFSLGFSQCIIRRQGQSDGQTRSVKSLTDADLITIVRLYSLFITLVSYCVHASVRNCGRPCQKPKVWDISIAGDFPYQSVWRSGGVSEG